MVNGSGNDSHRWEVSFLSLTSRIGNEALCSRTLVEERKVISRMVRMTSVISPSRHRVYPHHVSFW